MQTKAGVCVHLFHTALSKTNCAKLAYSPNESQSGCGQKVDVDKKIKD